MKYLFIGVILAILGGGLSFVIWGMEQAYLITGGVGVIFLGLATIVSGSMVSGDRMRANFAFESTDERKERFSTTIRLAVIACPNVLVSIMLYYISSK